MTGTSLSTFNIFDLKKQKVLPFAVKEQMEEGCFGKVSLATTPSYQEQFIAKTIDLVGKSEHIHHLPHQLLRSTYREIAYLKQLDLLIGYQHDVANKKMIIIMKLLPGIPEFRVPPKTKRLAEFASFCALRQLHRKGIAHMDPHEYNFLFDEKTEKAQTIDFGSSQDAQIFRQIRDFYQFLILRRNKNQDKIGYFIDFYCTELKDHILANRFETAKTLFCYAAVIIAALSGVSVLGIASLLAQELIKATVLPSLSDLLSMLQDHFEFRAFNQKNRAAYRNYHYALIGVIALLQGTILALQITTLYRTAGTILTGLTTAFPLFDTLVMGIQLPGLTNSYQYWSDNAEKYLLTEKQIISRYQHKIDPHAKSNTFLPLFKQSSTSANTRHAVNTQNVQRSSALRRI